MNMTVANNSSILKQEPGSTVKHLNWPIPACLPAGPYNVSIVADYHVLKVSLYILHQLTLYECSRINGQFFYTITPVLIQIDNPNQSGQCLTNVNAVEAQPQASSPPLRSPFTPTVGQPAPSAGQSNTQSPTSSSNTTPPSSSGFVTSRSAVSSVPTAFPSGVITITLSVGGEPIPTFTGPITYTSTLVSQGLTTTVTKTAQPSTVTVVLVSMETQTLTATASSQASTTTVT